MHNAHIRAPYSLGLLLLYTWSIRCYEKELRGSKFDSLLFLFTSVNFVNGLCVCLTRRIIERHSSVSIEKIIKTCRFSICSMIFATGLEVCGSIYSQKITSRMHRTELANISYIYIWILKIGSKTSSFSCLFWIQINKINSIKRNRKSSFFFSNIK